MQSRHLSVMDRSEKRSYRSRPKDVGSKVESDIIWKQCARLNVELIVRNKAHVNDARERETTWTFNLSCLWPSLFRGLVSMVESRRRSVQFVFGTGLVIDTHPLVPCVLVLLFRGDIFELFCYCPVSVRFIVSMNLLVLVTTNISQHKPQHRTHLRLIFLITHPHLVFLIIHHHLLLFITYPHLLFLITHPHFVLLITHPHLLFLLITHPHHLLLFLTHPSFIFTLICVNLLVHYLPLLVLSFLCFLSASTDCSICHSLCLISSSVVFS